MALSQRIKNLLAATGMPKEQFRSYMDRQYEATEKAEKETKEKEKFKREEDYKHKQKQELAEYKASLKSESEQAKTQFMSVQEYRSASEKAAEKNMNVLDYLDSLHSLKSEQEAALKVGQKSAIKSEQEALKADKAAQPQERAQGIKGAGMVGAAGPVMKKLGQRYFGKQQPASTQASIQEGTVIVNDETGERLVLRGGQWQPSKK